MKTKRNSWLALALCALCACSDSGERTVFVRNVYLVRPEAVSKEKICVYPGVVEAARKLAVKVPLVVRLEGTNAEAGKGILAGSSLNIVAAADMADGAEKACRLAKGAGA